MVAFTKEEMERANKRLAEINKPYQGFTNENSSVTYR